MHIHASSRGRERERAAVCRICTKADTRSGVNLLASKPRSAADSLQLNTARDAIYRSVCARMCTQSRLISARDDYCARADVRSRTRRRGLFNVLYCRTRLMHRVAAAAQFDKLHFCLDCRASSFVNCTMCLVMDESLFAF